MSCSRIWMATILSILLGSATTASTLPTKLPKIDMRASPVSEGEVELFIFDREQVDKINAMFESERAARKDLIECRQERAKPDEGRGWDPLAVVLVAGGVVIVVGGVAFLAGYLVAK